METIIQLHVENAAAREMGTSDVNAVRWTVHMMESTPFTSADVEKECQEFGMYETPSRSSISVILNRLARDGKIKVAETGAGRRATRYEKIPGVSVEEE